MKICTNIEQSKKLAEFLPKENADMYWSMDEIPFLAFPVNDIVTDWEYAMENGMLPAWSLAALLGVLPNDLDASTVLSNGGWDVDTMEHKKGKWLCDYVHDLDSKCHTTSANNPVDACVAMIEKLHEQNLL